MGILIITLRRSSDHFRIMISLWDFFTRETTDYFPVVKGIDHRPVDSGHKGLVMRNGFL